MTDKDKFYKLLEKMEYFKSISGFRFISNKTDYECGAESNSEKI